MGGWIGRWNTEEILQQIVDDAIAALDLSKIEQLDSSVEVIDTGAGGVVNVTIDGNECFRFLQDSGSGDIPMLLGTKDDNGFYLGAEVALDTKYPIAYLFTDGTACTFAVLDPTNYDLSAALNANPNGGNVAVHRAGGAASGIMDGSVAGELKISALINEEHITLNGNQAGGGGSVVMGDLDPDGPVTLYNAGGAALKTLRDVGDTDGDGFAAMYAGQEFQFFYDSFSSNFNMVNDAASGNLTITLEKNLGGASDVFNADPDFSVQLGYNGTWVFKTLTDGFGVLTDTGKVYLGESQDAYLQYDGTDMIILTDAVAPSDLKVDCGTEKTLELVEPVYKDLNLGAAQFSQPSSSQPDTDSFRDEGGTDTGIETLAFAVGEKVHAGFEIQHDYKNGSDFIPHVHFQIIAAPTGTDNVNWQMDYVIMRDDETTDTKTVITTGDTAVDTQYENYRADFAAIDGSTAGPNGTPVQIGDQFFFTLTRIAAVGDAFAGDALIQTAGIHYQVDTLGSRQIGTK